VCEMVPLLLWLSEKFAERMGGSHLLPQLMKDIAEHNLSTAGAFMAKLSEPGDEKHAS